MLPGNRRKNGFLLHRRWNVRDVPRNVDLWDFRNRLDQLSIFKPAEEGSHISHDVAH